MWARRASAGRVAGLAQPGGGHGRRGEPALGGAGAEASGGGVPCAPLPGRDRAQPRGLRVQCGGEQVVRGAEVLGAQDQAVDVPLAQPYRARIRAMRRSGRGGGLVKLSRHDSPVITHVTLVTDLSRRGRERTGCDRFVSCAERAEPDARAP